MLTEQHLVLEEQKQAFSMNNCVVVLSGQLRILFEKKKKASAQDKFFFFPNDCLFRVIVDGIVLMMAHSFLETSVTLTCEKLRKRK